MRRRWRLALYARPPPWPPPALWKKAKNPKSTAPNSLRRGGEVRGGFVFSYLLDQHGAVEPLLGGGRFDIDHVQHAALIDNRPERDPVTQVTRGLNRVGGARRSGGSQLHVPVAQTL